MPVTEAVVTNRPNFKSWDITATADGDTVHSFAHGFPATPLFTMTQKILALVTQWAITADAVNINIIKDTAVGTGNAGAQMRVTAMLPHSLVL